MDSEMAFLSLCLLCVNAFLRVFSLLMADVESADDDGGDHDEDNARLMAICVRPVQLSPSLMPA